MKREIDKQLQKNLKGTVEGVKKRICGEQIGSGSYRDVYIFKQDPNYVVKIERDMSIGGFANAMEWRNYIQNEPWILLGPWLAKCQGITATGQILIQERVYWEGKQRKDYPKYVPIMFCDLKLANFGWTKKGKFVCCDYSFFTTPMTARKMKYAKWWGSIKNLKTK